jgi:hypothetical protein
MAKKTFLDIIIATLEKVQKPLSPQEIWQKANELNLLGDFKSEGKTPWATIGAYCYTDIQKKGELSRIIQKNKRPAQFLLKKYDKIDKIDEDEIEKDKIEIKSKKSSTNNFKERDLHPLLVTFLNSSQHFKAKSKTIFHEKSSKTTKGQNEWLHPDIVGVYFPFDDYEQETLEIQSHLSISSIKLFSFELKKNLNFQNLREYYFQSVSNSSWANEGYLVILKMEEDPVLTDEIRRLNNAFGIGVIKLNIESVYESEILFPARINSLIDWDTVNRLVEENGDFKMFLNSITEDCKLNKVKSLADYDEVLDDTRLKEYIEKKRIS